LGSTTTPLPAKPLPVTQREERQGERLEVSIVGASADQGGSEVFFTIPVPRQKWMIFYLRLRGMYQWTVPVESRIMLGELSIYLRLRGMYQWTVPVESRIMFGELSIILITRNRSSNGFQTICC
jgi:hypothetical protein